MWILGHDASSCGPESGDDAFEGGGRRVADKRKRRVVGTEDGVFIIFLGCCLAGLITLVGEEKCCETIVVLSFCSRTCWAIFILPGL